MLALQDSILFCIFATVNQDIMKKSAVIYARVSSVGDRQSCERQVRDLSVYANKEGYKVAEVYEEHISGAKRNDERPVLCECLDYCFNNGIHTLLLSELSRLGRSVDEVLANVRLCKQRNLNIYFQKENLNIFNPDGTANPFLTVMISVLGTCAEMERENIKFRLNSGRAKYIAEGGKMGRPQGSVKDDEAKKTEYREAISLLKRGYSVRNTARLCNIGISTVQRLKKNFQL